MIKQIGGKKYNKDTAEFIWSYKAGQNLTEIYRKRGGEFFTVEYSDGERLSKVVPLSYEAAEDLLKDIPESKYKDLFCGGSQKTSMMIRLSQTSIVKLKKAAVEGRCNISDIINSLCEKYL